MKIFKTATMLALAGALSLALPASAGLQAKTYQVTGAVLELTQTTPIVQQGDEKRQVARDKGTKIAGDLKVGAKVTIQYRCVATDVEVESDKPDKKSK
jgi:bifunctional N-acetylglucosamine-1-phosphate-uridyltransferase/glucosamine-1-phosphate-acetyltransferase GlmU-like protein